MHHVTHHSHYPKSVHSLCNEHVHVVQRIETRVQFEIPVMEPVFTKNIEIDIMDDNNTFENLTARHECISTLMIDYAKLKKDHNGYMKPQWMYAYGAHVGYQRGDATKMNQGLIEGTDFRGALLIECKVDKKRFDTDTGRKTKKLLNQLFKGTVLKSKCEKLRKKKKGLSGFMDVFSCTSDGALSDSIGHIVESPKCPSNTSMMEYYLKVDLYEGAEINKFKTTGTQKAFVMVSINDHEKEVNARSTEMICDTNSRVKWYQKFQVIGPFLLPAGWDDALIVVPDVFIYLHIGGKPVAYRRLPLREIAKGIHPEDPQWYTMKKNKPLNKYKDDVFPGELLMALNCVRYPTKVVTKEVDEKEFEEVQEEPVQLWYAHSCGSPHVPRPCATSFLMSCCSHLFTTVTKHLTTMHMSTVRKNEICSSYRQGRSKDFPRSGPNCGHMHGC